MKILFISDFDNTLGDTYWPYWEGNIFRTKTLKDIAKATEIYEKYRRGPDDIVMYPSLLEAYAIKDPYKFFKKAGMDKQLFDDVVDALERLQHDDHVTTVILTTGDEEFQKLKTDVTWVDALVEEVYVTRDRNKIAHIHTLHEKYKPDMTVFLDDRIHMTSDDFDFPIMILDMDRKWEKEGENVVHGMTSVLDYLKAFE